MSIVYYGRGSQVVLTEKGVEYARTMLSETNENTDKMASCLNSASNSESFIGDFTPGLIGGNAPGIEIDQVISTTGNRTKGSVMIVDDEADVLMTYKLHLTERGFEVYAFRDPVLATKVFRRDARQIDVVLLDLRMAQMNGIQVFQKLKGIRPDVNIIFISGLDAAPELTSALPGLQSTDVFSKPVDLDKLTDKLCAVVSRKKMNT